MADWDEQAHLDALWRVVKILGYGGGEPFTPANDPLQDNDHEALNFLREYLTDE